MSKSKTRTFDPAEYQDDDAAVAAYLSEALETGDGAFVGDAPGVVARAPGLRLSVAPAGVELAELRG
ncbi:MAG TPA: hypothetical protein VHX13_02045 [Acidobacteriaceae bacterium]|jgi:probable addiction module antidote protein|nr:hypothetical protein [Acidobacteriaceae bacterium]